jgi:putative ABC transport system ATP-binding protein
MAEVRIRDLDFHYPGSRSFGLKVADLHVPAGECAAIVGPSGSGKTTLLNLVAGTLPPGSGEIHIGSTCLNRLGETSRRRFRSRNIGQVFQAFELLDYLSAVENVMLGPIIDSSINTQLRTRAADLLDSVGLGKQAHAKPARLSHGERQRVAVCRAMLSRPALVLADEPTGNLDETNKQTVVDLLIKQAREHESTLLMVTHDKSLLGSFDRVIDFAHLNGATP